MCIVADAADGADGVMGSVLTQGRYPDCPCSQPPLAAEDNLDPEGAEEVCARRSRPASARGLLGQPERLMPTCKRSDALPVHCALSATISRTRVATGSTSMMFSIASRRLLE